MLRLKTLAAGLAFALVAGGSAQAAPIAQYNLDFATPGPNPGWAYMWNVNGPIGNTANYTSMSPSGTRYDTGGTGWPRPEPGAYANLISSGGHPGRGSTQNYGGSGNTIDRYVIASYKVQSGQEGFHQISNSSISVGGGTGIDVRVYVNDVQCNRIVEYSGGGASQFNTVLGNLNAGYKVYVAIGPNTHDGSDGFSGLDYHIEPVTDASVMLWDADGPGPGGSGG